jgi:hypothetical protein
MNHQTKNLKHKIHSSVQKKKTRKNSMNYQNQSELKLNNSIIYFYKKKNYILSCDDTEHSHFKK